MFISVNINPKAKGGAMLDFHPIASACGKSSDAVVFICRSDVLYLDKEKRTKAWLASVRLQLSAVDESTFDSIGSVAYGLNFVKIEGKPFKEIFGVNLQMEQRLQASSNNRFSRRRAGELSVADVCTYEAGNEKDRLEKRNSRPEVKFSRREDVEFLEDKYYGRLIDSIEEQKIGGYTRVGAILNGSVLSKIGLPLGDLYFDNRKIVKELNDHSDHLSKAELKRIPEILRNPIVIIQVQRESDVEVFGDLWFGKSPFMIAIVVTTRENKLIIPKIRTAHARRNYEEMISEKTILYLNPDKKRPSNGSKRNCT